MATYLDAIGYLERLAAAARADGAAAAADAMAAHFITHERDVTLNSGVHARGYTATARHRRGLPPRRVTGWLGDSFRLDRAAHGNATAVSRAGPTAIYSRVQERGAVIEKRPGFMKWTDDYFGPMQAQYRHVVNVGPHPYMRRGVLETIADGSLRRNAAEAFATVTGAEVTL